MERTILKPLLIAFTGCWEYIVRERESHMPMETSPFIDDVPIQNSQNRWFFPWLSSDRTCWSLSADNCRASQHQEDLASDVEGGSQGIPILDG